MDSLLGSTGICANTIYKISFRRQRRIIFVDITMFHKTSGASHRNINKAIKILRCDAP